MSAPAPSDTGELAFPRRHMDALDAGLELQAWLERLAVRVRARCDGVEVPFWEIDYASHERSDGKTVLVWWQRKLIGTAVLVRDEMNFAVLTCWEIAELPLPTSWSDT